MIPLANPSFDGNEIAYVAEALKSGWVSKGDFIGRFERAWTGLYGLPAVACSSGTGALHLALLAAGVGPGDDVIVPDITFASTAAVVKAIGASPVLADIEGFTITRKTIERVLTPATRAIIPVHLYGEMAPMKEILDLAKEKRLIVIDDAAEITEPYYVASDYACFSLYGNKQITTGEGGMVVCRDPDRVRHWRDHGMTKQYYHDVAGLNYRMTNLQAAVGCAQMERYWDLYEARLRNYRKLKEAIPEGEGHWLYVVPKRRMKTVETRPVFDPLHTLPPYRNSGHFPGAERLHRDFMCLPIAPHLSEGDIDTIIKEYVGA